MFLESYNPLLQVAETIAIVKVLSFCVAKSVVSCNNYAA
jgi:hypothetical protein